MPTTKVVFNIRSLKEVENQMNIQDLPPEGLPVCNSRLGLEIKHSDTEISVSAKVIATYEGKVVMSYVVEGLFSFDDITKYFELGENQLADKVGILPTLVVIVVDALRGMQSLRLTGTPYYAVLPYIDPIQLLEKTHVKEK